eukprot:TRINITY_DN4543_c0_g1_i1.p1 TRINITY_DN4543_c0_g1~~TRINITY_DN4543_c0_g1_i1.p1  ORF type:complete len:402 (+),score=57.12 TRINITY_DN4543_c0_g1_i1:41-1246(+)
MSSLDDDDAPDLVDMIEDGDDESGVPSLLTVDEVDMDIEKSQSTEARPRVPLTVLTGFLGSGKTTLLKYIFTKEHGKRIAVIQNEFGEDIGIEKATVMGEDGQESQEWLELPNGCVCCSVKSDLVLTIETLMERKDRFDYILLETTGVADPGPLISSFWMDDELHSDVYLDGVLTVVDSKHILERIENNIIGSFSGDGDIEKMAASSAPVQGHPSTRVNEAQRQIAFADRVLVNKCDLVTEVELKKVESIIRTINSLAPLYRTEHCQINLDALLGIGAYLHKDETLADMEARAGPLIPGRGAGACSNSSTCDDKDHHHDTGHLHHDLSNSLSVTTICLERCGNANRDRLRQWLASLMWDDDERGDLVDVKEDRDKKFRYRCRHRHRTPAEWTKEPVGCGSQ